MGEFDDVLAMEPGDEWDDHDAGLDARPLVERAPLAAELRLPNAIVELRGDVPLAVVDALVDLTDPRLELWDDAPRVVLTVAELDGRLEVIDQELGAVATAAGGEELLDSLVDTLGRTAERTDPTRLHLAAASVEMQCDGERCGLILVDPDCSTRHRLVAEMLDAGAAYLSADRAVLLPGSRTTFASPTPVGRTRSGSSARQWVPGSQLGRVVTCTTSRLVVLVRARTGAAPEVVALDPTEGIVELLRQGAGLERYGPAALDVVATLAGDASFWRLELDPDDERSLDGALRRLAELRPPSARRFVVVHQLEVDNGSPMRVMRTDEGGVLADGASGRVLAITAEERDAIERHHLDGTRAAADEDWSRLRAAGVEPPPRRPGAKRPVPPSAFGLPNAPTGAAATERWAGESPRPDSGAAGLGAIGEAVRRGVLVLDDAVREPLLERHGVARAEVRRVEAVLRDVVARLEAVDVVPLVLGAPVLAHDGVLPPEFTDVERIDLLLDHAAAAQRAVEDLAAAGFVESPVATRVGVDHTGDPVIMTSPDGVPVRLHVRLSVGPFGELVDHREIRGRSVPLSLGGLWCRALHPEDRFVLAGVQLDVRDAGHGVQELRELILSAPRVESLMAGALDASDRWGATRSLLAALRVADDALPGLPAWLTTRARHVDAGPRRRRGWRGRRTPR